jgi:cold shock CspA family protein
VPVSVHHRRDGCGTEDFGFTSLVEGAKVTFDIVPHKGKESAENLKVT